MRLLLAEDEKSLSHALVTILEKSHYSVDAVYDGQEALEYLESEAYDGLILDIMMPKVDGITVLKTIRKQGNKIPVLILSAKSEIEDKVDGLDAGANDYLAKPFDARELLARIRVITRVNTESNDSLIRFGHVTLNRKTYVLKGEKAEFKLANKEFQMMELLMANPHQVLSTDRIFEKIWGYESDTEINIVWVYIAYLRKKLVKMHADIEIKAHRNVGYSVELKENDS
ncbi:putative uncharacterized protein [Firmicutes bacterium CAG:536]|jgi:DNA-binding response OmpR family regulator|nr:DNA-binding response regulator [Firmicutes bacterium AM41-11]CDA33990.1 putative uncharacterized protein [Firmicutes bacterium CAG:536]CRH84464.1 sigma-54 dependent response regulator [Chlamydia trachomatis]